MKQPYCNSYKLRGRKLEHNTLRLHDFRPGVPFTKTITKEIGVHLDQYSLAKIYDTYYHIETGYIDLSPSLLDRDDIKIDLVSQLLPEHLLDTQETIREVGYLYYDTLKTEKAKYSMIDIREDTELGLRLYLYKTKFKTGLKGAYRDNISYSIMIDTLESFNRPSVAHIVRPLVQISYELNNGKLNTTSSKVETFNKCVSVEYLKLWMRSINIIV